MICLTWQQVLAWRQKQQMLAARPGRRHFTGAAGRIVGAQAQVMSAAELAIGARVEGLAREDVQRALWHDRSLVKVWAMRGTIHVFAAGDLPLIVAAQLGEGRKHRLRDFLQLGFTEAQYDHFMQAVPRVLADAGGEPVTREALANGLAERMKSPELSKALLGSSWGTLWKPSMYRGDLCFGPGDGRTKTFVNPRTWLAEWKEWEPEEAQREVTRRYLMAYGPATPRDFSFWWDGGGRVYGKKMFEMLGDEVETVDVEGWKATALKSTLESLANTKPEHSVRMLPMFDVYVLTQSRNIEPFLAAEHKGKVFRPAAWVSAVVLVDGRIEGVWEYEARNGRTLVKVNMFAPPAGQVREEIEAEAARLEGFFDSKVAVDFAEAA